MMNLDTAFDLKKNDENQENFEKKKKIIVISLSAALLLITLIAGLFWVKKNKESSYKNNDLEKVIDNEKKNNENDNDNKNEEKENEEIIVNRSEYFFEKTLAINIFSFLIIGILFFFWENDKLPEEERGERADLCERLGEFGEDFLCSRNAYCGKENIKEAKDIGFGLFEKSNWFGFATLGTLVVIPLLVEPVLNLLIGSISHFLSKGKSKRYLHTLRMSLRKRIQYFLSFSVVKTFLVVVGYLLCGIIVAMVARTARKYHPCCCRDTGEIVVGHGANYCCGFCEVSIGMQKGSDNQEEMRQVKFISLDNMLQNQDYF